MGINGTLGCWDAILNSSDNCELQLARFLNMTNDSIDSWQMSGYIITQPGQRMMSSPVCDLGRQEAGERQEELGKWFGIGEGGRTQSQSLFQSHPIEVESTHLFAEK